MTSPDRYSEIRTRLAELESEHASGEELMRHLTAEQQRVRDSLLRIGGAIQVLRELLGPSQDPAVDQV